MNSQPHTIVNHIELDYFKMKFCAEWCEKLRASQLQSRSIEIQTESLEKRKTFVIFFSLFICSRNCTPQTELFEEKEKT